jgi:cytoskeleton protein RodZ
MESIGERLKAAREQRGVTHDQIARETNIAKRYLVALEEEDFASFPGDTYLLGFLRNYAEYLGLRGEELASAYRNMRIQEQPVPVEELISRRGSLPPIAWIGIVSGGLAAIAVVALSIALAVKGGSSEAVGSAPPEKKTYELSQAGLERRLYAGDGIVCEVNGEKFKLEIAQISDAVFIESPSGRLRYALGEEFGIDLDSDNVSDIRGSVRDFMKGNPEKGAMIRLAYSSSLAGSPASDAIALAASPAAVPGSSAPLPAASSAPQADVSKGQILIESRTSPYPFTMNVTFRQYCMFRHEVDRKKERTERYYRKTEQISANANDGVRIWASNASACVVQVIAGGKTVNVELGRPGEVVVKNIKWVQADGGGWALAALPVD